MDANEKTYDSSKRELLLHFLAAIAYRTQKALRNAPSEFGDFRPMDGVRTPAQLVRHMTSVLGYARTFFTGGTFWPDELPRFSDEIERFHQTLEDLGRYIRTDEYQCELSPEQLLHGPLSDAMTHAGQLAMLRRMAGIPVAPENFIFAEIASNRLGSDQADAAAPDKIWDEAPDGWTPPE